MQKYIEQIIETEQLFLINKIYDRYGTIGNFTVNDLRSKFIDNKTIKIVNDEFKTPGKRGRPRKTQT